MRPDKPCRKPRPCPPRFLVPRVVDASQEHCRCLPAVLAVSGLPCGLCGPFTLLSVEVSCQEEIRLEPRRADRCGCTPGAALIIPLTVWVCDGCGRRFCGASELCLPVRMPSSCPGSGSLIAQASVRLVRSECACEPTFDVLLDVSADVYRVRFEPCRPDRPPKPVPPPLPMYPQPRY